MKNLIFMMLSFILVSSIIHSQTITETKQIYTSGTSIQQVGANYSYGSYNMGKEVNGGTTYIYRSYFEVDLSEIPTSATINWVKVYYTSDYKNYSFKLTNLSSLGGTLGATWSSIGSSSSFQAGIAYGSSNFTSSSIKTQMQSSLSSRGMYIGAASQDETANDSYSYLSIYLEVNYTRPAESLDFYVQNYMDGNTGGTIGVGENTPTITPQSSPYSFQLYETQTMYFQAYDDQSASSYNWVFNDSEAPLEKSKWEKILTSTTQLGSSSSMSRGAVKTEDGATFQAVLKKECSITLQNNLPYSTSAGVIKVNNVQVNSPSTGNIVVEKNAISGTAVDQTINGLRYTFSNWSTSSSSYTTTFYPEYTTTYTANYSVKPVWTNRGMYTNSTPGQYITVYWNEHPCSDVIYKIYRKIRHNGVMGSEVLRATISHGTTNWTDNIQIADGQTTDLVFYDVRAYHTPSSAYSDVNYEATVYTWTEQNIKNGDESANAGMEAEELPVVEENESEIVLGNYPNPFNPTTNINYSLAEDGFVSLKVYNILGKEVATLVNDTKPAGSYNVSFNGANLPSGVYIYTLQTNSQSITRKMLLLR